MPHPSTSPQLLHLLIYRLVLVTAIPMCSVLIHLHRWNTVKFQLSPGSHARECAGSIRWEQKGCTKCQMA